MFNRLLPRLVPALLLVAAITLPAHAESAPPTRDFDVYVDLPTAFAFVKTPVGWKFVRKLDASQLKALHPTTLTSLLAPAPDVDAGSLRIAGPESGANAVRAKLGG
jgi:hypothetical protein